MAVAACSKAKPTDADINNEITNICRCGTFQQCVRPSHSRERVKEPIMRYRAQIDRRAFIVSAAAASGGLALGLEIPFGGAGVATAQAASPEVNAWVVI